MSDLSLPTIQKMMPKGVHKSLTQDIVDKINKMSEDPDEQAAFRETMITYSSVLQDGKYKMDDYLNAVKYVTFKFMNLSNIAAYSKAFPERMENLVKAGKSEKDISAYVAMYAKNKLVNAIIEQSAIPDHILYQGIRQEAIQHELMLMRTARSEKVQHEAAATLIKELKAPEVAKVELDVKTNDNALNALNEKIAEMAVQTAQMIKAGAMTAHDAAVAPITVNGESERVED